MEYAFLSESFCNSNNRERIAFSNISGGRDEEHEKEWKRARERERGRENERENMWR